MSDAKRASQQQGTPFGSYIRAHDGDDLVLPPAPALHAGRFGAAVFLDDWAQRHFAVSVKLHDAERVSLHDGAGDDSERGAVLADLAIVQGVLLELHELATNEPRVQSMMDSTHALQNGVAALYSWLDDVLEQVGVRRVAQGRPGFVDAGDEALAAIVRTLDRVHPDLESLVREEALGVDADVAQKLSICFRQIGAAIVRVSGRDVSSAPPM